MEILGIQFAPLNVPLERRLQTLAVATWLLLLVLLGPTTSIIFIYLLIFTKFWWLVLLYLIWMWVIDKDASDKGGRPIKWVRSLKLWKYIVDYFPLKLEKLPSTHLDPKRNYLFCVFPHGLCLGACGAFTTEHSKFKKFFPNHTPRLVTMNPHYYMPVFRDFVMSMGCISATWKSVDYMLSRPQGDHVCVIIVGGVPETYLYKYGDYSIALKQRKGFVKLALKNGTPLVPVLSFGETSTYRHIDGPFIRFLKNKLNFPEHVFLNGRGIFQYSFGLLPRRVPITTVVGNPLEVPKIENPTREQVAEYHEKFAQALTDLFEEQKYHYVDNPEETFLNIK